MFDIWKKHLFDVRYLWSFAHPSEHQARVGSIQQEHPPIPSHFKRTSWSLIFFTAVIQECFRQRTMKTRTFFLSQHLSANLLIDSQPIFNFSHVAYPYLLAINFLRNLSQIIILSASNNILYLFPFLKLYPEDFFSIVLWYLLFKLFIRQVFFIFILEGLLTGRTMNPHPWTPILAIVKEKMIEQINLVSINI
jgi:hypothetical protein